jgi:hypothetical protein
MSHLAREATGLQAEIVPDVVLARAWIVALNDVLEVLVDHHRRRAEYGEVHIHDGDGVVEVGLLKDVHHPALA